ncbi:hypothetical protein Tco_0664489 [Tanacetum coccineum]
MSTLAELMIVVGADNRPPMLDKPMYESWKIRMELYIQEKLQVDCDIKATNIVLQGLPQDVYSLINHHKVAKEIWDKVKLLMQGTSLLKQERKCKLYEEFDKFSHVKGETLYEYTSNYDQLYAYLEQHKAHANEAYLMRERFLDPLALFSPPTQHVYSSPPQSNPYGEPHHPQQYPTTYPTNLSHTQPSVPQNAYPPSIIPQQPQAEFPQLDSRLAIPTFLPGNDPISF